MKNEKTKGVRKMNKKDLPYLLALIFAIGGAILIFLFSGCTVTHVGGYVCPEPLNCLEGHAKIEPPPVLRNLYDIAYKETGPDRAGKGFVRYDIIKTPQCQLNRKVQVDVPGHKQQILTCNIADIFAEYYIPIKRPTRITFKLLGPLNETIEEKVITISPDINMIRDYSEGGVQYGWRIIAMLSRQGTLRFNVSDHHWIEPRY